MARRVSMATRAELLGAVGVRYRDTGRAERSLIVDRFAALSGYRRKHAIRLLAGGGDRKEDTQVYADGGGLLRHQVRGSRDL